MSDPTPRRAAEPDPRPILVFGPWSRRYDMGPAHPLTPRRFGPGIDLLRALHDVAGGGPIRELEPAPASDDELLWSHTPAYLETVRRFSEQPLAGWEAGIGPGDTPAFAGMHDASAAVAGGSIRAMEAILAGEATHAFHPGGGLHHALPDRASGFCVYDDPALAIALARRQGRRVLYLDFDVHHGDGVQDIHADDPGVLTLSIHQSGRTLFPGTGFINELGEGSAAGTALNLPMDPGTGERGWLAAILAVLPVVAAAFRPDVVVSQHGADAHAWDPLANLRVTTTAMGEVARLVDGIAHRWAGGRWLATGGGGYDAYRVVPRAWSHVWLAAAHLETVSTLPSAWRERWAADAQLYGQWPLPERLDDTPNAGLRQDAAQDLADTRAAETAAIVRELAVPILVRVAGDLRWWRAVDDLGDTGPGGATDHVAAAPDPAAASPGDGSSAGGRPTIIDDVDPATWAGLVVAERVLPPGDPGVAHSIVAAALAGPGRARVTAAVADGRVVGAVVSVAGVLDGIGGPGATDAAGVGGGADAGRRLLLAVGVAPGERRRGLAGELLRRHVAASSGERWEAAVAVAERDPVEPLPRRTRATVARRLLEGAGFRVERAGGPVGAADPDAIVARLG